MDSAHRRERAARALVIFPGALGDLICAVPAIRAIARRYPGANLELMARGELARFAVGRIAAIARAHSIDSRVMSAIFKEGGGRDEAARAFFGGFGAVYSFFASADGQYRAALGEAARGAEISFHPFRPEYPGHVAAAYLRAVGAPRADLDSSIALLESDLADASQILSRAGLEKGRYLMILPGSGAAAKNWPPERFVALAGSVAQTAGSLVVLGPAEEALADKFAGKNLRVERGLSLATVAALARMSAAFVGNDSGVSHLAAAAGASGVVIFGPTDPRRWLPLGKVAVISHDPLSELAMDTVLLELRQIIDAAGTGARNMWA
jgi:ADP-heptose:LPS heptosyltransferase